MGPGEGGGEGVEEEEEEGWVRRGEGGDMAIVRGLAG
jgi:hypothetical protein